ncbi:MAG: DUF3187 family protein [Leptospiraceae bacterium]|nr:DUF3187 family protein [Leptospiraceae bacterium]
MEYILPIRSNKMTSQDYRKWFCEVLLKTLVLFIVSILSIPLNAFSDYPYGVNFQVIRQPLLPLDNDSLKRGSISGRLTFRYMNVWSRQQNYFLIDGEEAQTEATLRYALLDRWTINGSFSYISQGGGMLDTTVERFHRYTGVTQGDRDRYPRDRMNVSYEPFGAYYGLIDNNPARTLLREFDSRIYPRSKDDPPITIEEVARSSFKDYIFLQRPELAFQETTEVIALRSQDRMGAGSPRAFTEFDLYSGKYLDKLKFGLQYKFPVRDSFLLASPGYDRSVFLVAGKSFMDKFYFKLGISHTWFGETSYYQFSLPKTRWVLRNSLEYSLSKTSIVSLEYVVTESPFVNFGKLGKPTHQVGFGYKKLISNGTFTFGVVEDIINYATSPDIGFYASFEAKR